MKLLFDENLSPRLAQALADLYPNSSHVHQCGLGSADDADIWDHARQNHFTIVSKDSDFQDRSILYGHPPKFIWLRTQNCSTLQIESLLRSSAETIQQFIKEDEESYLILGQRRRHASSRNPMK